MIACLSLLDVSKHYSSDSRGVRLPFALECYFYQRFSFLICHPCIYLGNMRSSFAWMTAVLSPDIYHNGMEYAVSPLLRKAYLSGTLLSTDC